MARTKSANPRAAKSAKSSAAEAEQNLTATNGTLETQKKGPQPVEALSQSPTVRSTTQKAQNGSRSQNGASNVTEEQIRQRAYQLYLERGRQHGRHEDDWYRAESELRGYSR